jgi:sugar phosphate permease
VTVFLLFSALLAWQLGALSHDVLVRMPAVTWGLAVCFLAVAALSWRNFFAVPGVFATAVSLCLLAAAWLSGRPA